MIRKVSLMILVLSFGISNPIFLVDTDQMVPEEVESEVNWGCKTDIEEIIRQSTLQMQYAKNKYQQGLEWERGLMGKRLITIKRAYAGNTSFRQWSPFYRSQFERILSWDYRARISLEKPNGT